MAGTSDPKSVSTKLQQIAKLAREAPDMVLLTLAHHIDLEFLREAYRRTRKNGAAGVDGQTASEYEADLEGNLRSLLERFKSGLYRAPPVRRVHIPKGDGSKTRPIGIPTLEDKVLQRATSMVLEAVYEQDFLDCSYGFRPGRSAHRALEAIWERVTNVNGGWVLEADIKSYFDTISHQELRNILDQRVRDGVLRRVIHKWLKAGVMEDGAIHYPEAGSPQGGVISPLLANIYLHVVLDTWFEEQVKPCLEGEAHLVRYADDFIIIFASERDARRVMDVLPKRFGKYGLQIHPDKTRLLDFRRPPRKGPRSPRDPDDGPGTFPFLGFTHYWGKSRRGNWVVKRKTAKDRLTRSLQRVGEWCRLNRHLQVRRQHAQLVMKLRGHNQYYGIVGNTQSLRSFQQLVQRIWRRWLNRRSQHDCLSWRRFQLLLACYPLPQPRIAHSAHRG